MKFLELQEKMEELLKALKNRSSLLENNDAAVRKSFLDCKANMENAEAISQEYKRLNKELEELCIKVNSLKQQEDNIFNSKVGWSEKIDKFAYASESTAKKASELKSTKDQLFIYKEKMLDEEVNKKLENLTTLWNEIKKEVDFEAEEEPEVIELEEQIEDSITEEVVVSEEELGEVDDLLEALKGISSEETPKKKRGFFRR